MLNQKNKSTLPYFLPALYLLFAAFVFGCFCGVHAMTGRETGYYVSNEEGSVFRSVVLDCLIYHAAVLAVIRLPLGEIMVPLIMFARGWILTSTASVLYVTGIENLWKLYIGCSVSALLQIMSLFYFAAFGMSLMICRKHRRRIVPDMGQIQTIKRGVFVAVLALLLSMLLRYLSR